MADQEESILTPNPPCLSASTTSSTSTTSPTSSTRTAIRTLKMVLF